MNANGPATAPVPDAMNRWLQRWIARRSSAARIQDGDWNRVLASSALFARLDAAESTSLRVLVGRFLARKRFSGAAGHELTHDQRLVIAALACLPVLHLGFDCLAGWQQVIVYPGGFRVRREHHDEHTGVVTEFDDDLIGEAWERGPVILSWDDIAADLAEPFAGFNVVIHEIAHKLDLLDGVLDGTPRLPRHLPLRDWVAAMQPAYDAHVRQIEHGHATLIDPYAAESVEEYFAVVSELHFSDPATLERAAPAVAAVLRRLFSPARN